MKPYFLYTLIAWTVPALVIAVDNDVENEQILILDNERTLHGKIERLGNRYRLRRGGGVTWINADRVIGVCDNKESAWRFLRKRSNLTDPDERLKLARWCYVQQLYDHAFAEVQEAVRLRPNHRESQELFRYFKSLAERQEKPGRIEKPEPTRTAEQSSTPSALSASLSVEAMAEFTSEVQPVLMNACARCHARREKSSPFHLHRIEYGRLVDNRLTQQNLLAVLSQINPRHPESSTLLRNALRPHGTAKWAPLSGQKMVAYRKLEAWVKSTLEEHPDLKSQLLSRLPPVEAVHSLPEPKPTAVKPAQPEARSGFGEDVRPTAQAQPGVAVKPAVREVPAVTQAPTEKTAPREVPRSEKKLVGIRDEFDPAIFNRQMHPDRSK